MSTIPYLLNGELIDLVPKSELDKTLADNAELLERLEERTQSHLRASARDVQTIQQQAVELSAARDLIQEAYDALIKVVRDGVSSWDTVKAVKNSISKLQPFLK